MVKVQMNKRTLVTDCPTRKSAKRECPQFVNHQHSENKYNRNKLLLTKDYKLNWTIDHKCFKNTIESQSAIIQKKKRTVVQQSFPLEICMFFSMFPPPQK